MNNDEMLGLILSKLENLESGQKEMRAEMNGMRADIEELKADQKEMRAEMNDMRSDIEDLKEGQKAIRRDVARIDRKIDRLANDVGDTLAIITEATDRELDKLRNAK